MKGRKPLPTALRILRGSREPQQGVNPDEPKPPALSFDVIPYGLTDALAKAEWQRIAPGLVACGQVTMADRALLVAYCLKYAQWLRLEEVALSVALADDPLRKIKIMRAASQTLQLVIRAAAELGLTPTSRTRVTRAAPVAPAAAPSKWSGVLP